MSAWSPVKLSDVLRHRKQFVTIDDLTTYKRTRVQLHAKGIVLRDEVPGGLIKTKSQQVCRTGDFLVAEIDAKVGGFGLVPDVLDGAIVSSHYFLFEIDTTRLDRRFLDYFTRTPTFREQVAAQGTTNYAAIRPGDVLGYLIPLPPLREQQRLVARIDTISGEVVSARGIAAEASAESDALLEAHLARLFGKSIADDRANLLNQVVLERGKFSHRPRNDPRFFGGAHPWIQIGEIESSARAITSWTETLNDSGLAISKKFPAGTVLVSIAATIGAVGILAFDCCVPDSIVAATPRPGVSPDFLYYYFRYVRAHLEAVAPQSAQKNVNLQILGSLPFPVISLAEQQRIVAELDALQAEVDVLKATQATSRAELDALLPAILDRAFAGAL